MTYAQFSNRFTRLCNKVFDQEMYNRFMLARAFLEEGENLLEKFRTTVEIFGGAEQTEAYDKLVRLINENPEHKRHMHYVFTP